MNKANNWKRISSKGLYPPRLSWLLLLPLRNVVFSPKKLIERIKPLKNWEILDLGCGPGYFSSYVAKHLTQGKLYLTDVQDEMVKKAKKRIEKFNLSNVEVQKTDGITLNYPDNKFDCIYLITVLGEIQFLQEMLNEIYRITKLGALISVTELNGDPDALTQKEVRQIFKKAGYYLKETFGNKRSFTVNFIKEITEK